MWCRRRSRTTRRITRSVFRLVPSRAAQTPCQHLTERLEENLSFSDLCLFYSVCRCFALFIDAAFGCCFHWWRPEDNEFNQEAFTRKEREQSCSSVITKITRATGWGRNCPPHWPHEWNFPGIDVFVPPPSLKQQLKLAEQVTAMDEHLGEFIASSVLTVIMTYANLRLSAEMSLFIRKKMRDMYTKIESGKTEDFNLGLSHYLCGFCSADVAMESDRQGSLKRVFEN